MQRLYPQIGICPKNHSSAWSVHIMRIAAQKSFPGMREGTSDGSRTPGIPGLRGLLRHLHRGRHEGDCELPPSLPSQRQRRIDAGGAARGQPGGQQHDRDEQR